MIPLINVTQFCSCGSQKPENKLFCDQCWEELPVKLSRRINLDLEILLHSIREARGLFASNHQEELK